MNIKKDQDKLEAELNQFLQENNLSDELKVDPTTIAVDVENRHVGKCFATVRIINWLKEKGINSRKFFAVGDSPSDLQMAEKLDEMGHAVDFIYVGRAKLPKDDYSFYIRTTQSY